MHTDDDGSPGSRAADTRELTEVLLLAAAAAGGQAVAVTSLTSKLASLNRTPADGRQRLVELGMPVFSGQQAQPPERKAPPCHPSG